MAQRVGIGMFPREFTRRFPLLPVEEEGRLHDAYLRESFVERVFAYSRRTTVLQQDATPGGLVEFHTAHKLTWRQRLFLARGARAAPRTGHRRRL